MVVVAIGASVMMPSAESRQQQRNRLEPVDPGVADTSPLSVSERLMPQDLRVPTAFERVYRLTGRRNGSFARVSGAVTAVFPRSQYVTTEEGDIPEIPPGTIFYLGGLPESEEDHFTELRARRSSNFVDTSAKDLALTGMPMNNHMPAQRPYSEQQMPAAIAVAGPSIFTDDLYRRMRLSELIGRAVGEGSPANGEGPETSNQVP